MAMKSAPQPPPRALKSDIRSHGGCGLIECHVGHNGLYRFFVRCQRVAVACRQEMRQQADRQMAGAAVETSDACAVWDFSPVGPVSVNPIIAPWALLDTCVAPPLLANVALAGVTARKNDLHRHPEERPSRRSSPFRATMSGLGSARKFSAPVSRAWVPVARFSGGAVRRLRGGGLI